MSRRKISCPIRGSAVAVGVQQKVKVAVASSSSITNTQSTNHAEKKLCARHGCNEMGTKLCSACNNETYCSPSCQKLDWKIHKILCLKDFDQLLPFEEVTKIVDKLLGEAKLKKGTENGLRVLLFAQKFSEYQFGAKSLNQAYRKRDNGDAIHNMVVDITILNVIYFYIGIAYQPTKENSPRSEWNKAVSYYEKSTKTLEPYRILFSKLDSDIKDNKDSESTDVHYQHTDGPNSGPDRDPNTDPDKNPKMDSLDASDYRLCGVDPSLITIENFNHVFEMLSNAEDRLGGCHTVLSNFIVADHFYNQAILHARKFNGEKSKKLKLLCQALLNRGVLFNMQNKPIEAMLYIQEAHSLMGINETDINASDRS